MEHNNTIHNNVIQNRLTLSNMPRDLLIKIIENMNKVYIIFSCTGDMFGQKKFIVEKVYSDYDKAKKYIDKLILRTKDIYKYCDFFEGERSQLSRWLGDSRITYLIEEFIIDF
jgi:hypothetical protein